MRRVTWYQVSASDFRNVGLVQIATTFFGAIGTFALSIYLDYSKDVAIARSAKSSIPAFVETAANIAFWAWIIFWFVALALLIWQGTELHRIKVEHGQKPFYERIIDYWKSR